MLSAPSVHGAQSTNTPNLALQAVKRLVAPVRRGSASRACMYTVPGQPVHGCCPAFLQQTWARAHSCSTTAAGLSGHTVPCSALGSPRLPSFGASHGHVRPEAESCRAWGARQGCQRGRGRARPSCVGAWARAGVRPRPQNEVGGRASMLLQHRISAPSHSHRHLGCAAP